MVKHPGLRFPVASFTLTKTPVSLVGSQEKVTLLRLLGSCFTCRNKSFHTSAIVLLFNSFYYLYSRYQIIVSFSPFSTALPTYNSWEKCLNSGEFERHFLWSFKVFQHFKKVLCQEQKLLKILLICHNWSMYISDRYPPTFFCEVSETIV